MLWEDDRKPSASKIWGAGAAERERLRTPISALRIAAMPGRELAQTGWSGEWTAGAQSPFADIVEFALAEIQ